MNKLQRTEAGPRMGPGLVVSILRKAGEPLTTRRLNEEVHKVNPICMASSVIGLNMMRVTGIIKGKRSEDGKAWVWWVD